MMERFIIDPKSVSPEAIRSDLMLYLESKPEALRWKAFYDSSAGQIIIDFIVGFVSFLMYHITVARREAYLAHAENRSSNIAIAQNLNYSVFRGRNARVEFTFSAVSEPLLLSKWQVIGTIGEADVLVADDVIINTGEAKRVTCIIGSIQEETIKVDSNMLKPFRFTMNNVSEDVRLYQNDMELEFTSQMKDLASGKHVLISNAFGSVDLYYLNNQTPFYDTNDEFKIEFIKLMDVEVTVDEINLMIPATDGEIVSTFVQAEEIGAIKVNAPLYFDTQYKIRGRNDFKKILRTLDSRIIDTNGRDYSASVVELTYIKNDLSTFDQVQKNAFIDSLSADLPYGTIAPFIADPMRTELGVTIVLKLNRVVNENIQAKINELLAPYEKKLQTTIDLEDVETALSKLEYVKNARVSTTISVRADSTFYKRLDFVAESLSCDEPKFEFFKHIRKTGSIEPTWPTSDGDTILDGRVFWQARDERTCNLKNWEADTSYEIGSKIKPENGPDDLIFVCVGTVNKSSYNPIAWSSEIGSITNDRELVWQAIEKTGTPDLWAPNTNYNIGDIVVPDVNSEVAYQVVAFRSLSGSTTPVFPTADNITFEDGDILWISRDRNRPLVASEWNEYIITKPAVTILNG